MTSAFATPKPAYQSSKPPTANRLIALVPAGGVGQRALKAPDEVPKQYRPIRHRPMLAWTVERLLADARVQHVVVGVQAGDTLAAALFEDWDKVSVTSTAGATRAQTVLQTLDQSIFAPEDWVLVHDAARPGLPLAALSRLIDACLSANQGGLLALSATDTVKLADEQQPFRQVLRTLPREQVWLAQTPQMFPVTLLRQALQEALAAQQSITDEASAMEWIKYQPLLIPGTLSNIKVTWPEDFEWIEQWL